MFRKGFKKFIASEDGVVLVLFAWTLPVLIGIAALAVDFSYTLSLRNDSQRAADNAAMSTSRAALASSSFADQGNGLKFSVQEAYAVAEMNGYKTGVNNTTVDVRTVPAGFQDTLSRYKDIAGSVEVNITQPQSLFFGSMYQTWNLTTTPPTPIIKTMKVRAVGQGTSACILVLNKRRDNTISTTGAGDINANCGFIVNSNFTTSGSVGAVTVSGAGALKVGSLTLRRPGRVWSTAAGGRDACPTPGLYANDVYPSNQNYYQCPYFSTDEVAVNPYAALNSTYDSSKPTPDYTIPATPNLSPDASSTSTSYKFCRTTGSNESNARFTVSSGSVSSTLPSGCIVSAAGRLGTDSAGAPLSTKLATSSNLTIDSSPATPSSTVRVYTPNALALGGTSLININNFTIQAGNPTTTANSTVSGSVTIKSGSTLISYGNLTISNGATLTIETGGKLFVDKGTLINNGTLSITGGEVFADEGLTNSSTLNVNTGGVLKINKTSGSTSCATNGYNTSFDVGAGSNVTVEGGSLIVQSGKMAVSGSSSSKSRVNILGSGANANPTRFLILTNKSTVVADNTVCNPGLLDIGSAGIFRTTDLNQTRTVPDQFLIQGRMPNTTDDCKIDATDTPLCQVQNSNVLMFGSGLHHIEGGIKSGGGYTTGTLNFDSSDIPITTAATTAGTTIALDTYGKFTFSGNTYIKLRAPGSGTWTNLAIYQKEPLNTQDPYSSSGDSTANFAPWNPPVNRTAVSSFQSAAAAISINGAVVLPWNDITYQAASVDPATCTFYIVNRFAFNGGSQLGSGCSTSSAISGIGQGFLVE